MANRPVPREMPEMNAGQKWRNWWDYHRRHVLLAGVVLLILAGILHEQMSQVKPDFTVGLVTRFAPTGEELAALEAALEAVCPDFNGDGTVEVFVNDIQLDYTTTATDSGTVAQLRAGVEKLQADFFTGQSGIFLLEDPENFQKNNQALRYLDGTEPEAGSGDWEQMVRPWGDCGAVDGVTFGNIDAASLWFGRRVAGDMDPGNTDRLWGLLFP